MSELSDEVYALAQKLCPDDDSNPLIDIRVDARLGASGPDWHAIVWDGQVEKGTDSLGNDVDLYEGLGVLAAASGMNLNEVLVRIRDVLKARTGEEGNA